VGEVIAVYSKLFQVAFLSPQTITLVRTPDTIPDKLGQWTFPLCRALPRQQKGRSPMFTDDDRRHPDWEMSRSAQRIFSIGAAIVFATVLLLNLVGSPEPNIWAEKPDAETKLASK
jgi:hypothetical protein